MLNKMAARTRLPLLSRIACIALLLAGGSTAALAASQPSAAVAQGPQAFSFMVGELRIQALSDGSVPQDLHTLLRDTTPDKTDALLHDAFLTNPVEASINAYLFRDQGHTVLVDTGSGDLFGPGLGGRLLESLATANVRPEQITDVLLTHAHDDHMGGLVHAGRITFPNATIHISQPELDFFLDPSNAAKAHYDLSYFKQAELCLRPYLNAGHVKAFASDGEVLPDVTAAIHPGHTPGSTFYTVTNHGDSIVFIGDTLHVAAVQFPDPSVTIVYDVRPAQAALLRQEVFPRFARDRTLIAVPHLSFPGVGHIRTLGSGYEWVPIPYTNRDGGPTTTFIDRHGK